MWLALFLFKGCQGGKQMSKKGFHFPKEAEVACELCGHVCRSRGGLVAHRYQVHRELGPAPDNTGLTPAQAEKVVKKRGVNADLTDHIEKPKGDMTLAPHSDPRPGIELGENPDNLTALVSKSS